MRVLRVLILCACTGGLAGCIDSTTLIKVRPDGSGTVEQTTLVNVASMRAMMPGMNAKPGQSVTDADLTRVAERMGAGVRLVSTEPVTANGFEGVKATFAFDDINQVQVNQDPNLGGGTGGGRTAAPDRSSNDPVRFRLARQGATSVLTVTIQDKPAASAGLAPEPGAVPDMNDPMMMDMIKSMFQGFKINIALEVVGSIVKTNAEYVSGPRITLLEMDMAALLEDEAKFKALQSKLGPDASLSSARAYLKDIKGIKIDGPVVSVEFK